MTPARMDESSLVNVGDGSGGTTTTAYAAGDQPRDAAFFRKSLDEGFRVTENTYKLNCIPWAQHSATFAESSISFHRQTGPCNIDFLSSAHTVDVSYEKVTFAHIVADAANYAPVIELTIVLLGVGYLVDLLGADDAMDAEPLIFGLWLLGIFVWYWFRPCLATFGTSGVSPLSTWVEFKRKDQKDLQDRFLDKQYEGKTLANNSPGSWQASAASWKNTLTKFCCIPTGSDEVTLGNHHLQVHSTTGILPCKKAKDTFIIMTDRIKWIHLSSSGRSISHLCNMIACVVVLIALLVALAVVPMTMSAEFRRMQEWDGPNFASPTSCHTTTMGRPCVAWGANDHGIEPQSTTCHTRVGDISEPVCYDSERRDGLAVCTVDESGSCPWRQPYQPGMAAPVAAGFFALMFFMVPIVVVLALVVLCWLGNTSAMMEFAFVGAPPGGLRFGKALYNGTWSSTIPANGLGIGSSARDEIMYKFLSTKTGRPCSNNDTPIRMWWGIDKDHGPNAKATLELHSDYVLVRRNATCCCCFSCCGKEDVYACVDECTTSSVPDEMQAVLTGDLCCR